MKLMRSSDFNKNNILLIYGLRLEANNKAF